MIGTRGALTEFDVGTVPTAESEYIGEGFRGEKTLLERIDGMLESRHVCHQARLPGAGSAFRVPFSLYGHM